MTQDEPLHLRPGSRVPVTSPWKRTPREKVPSSRIERPCVADVRDLQCRSPFRFRYSPLVAMRNALIED